MTGAEEARAALVPLDKVMFHPHNVRRNLGDLRQLTASIELHGILQPVVVEHYGQMLRLRMGHRRVAAARLAGLKKVPAIVHADALTDEDFLFIAMHENVIRRGLNKAEVRDAAQALLELGCTRADIAANLGVAVATVGAWLKSKPVDKRTGVRVKPRKAGLEKVLEEWGPRLSAGLSPQEGAELVRVLDRLAHPERYPTSGPRRSSDIDDARVIRACDGQLPYAELTHAEREQAMRRLHHARMSDYQIAERLQTTPRTALRLRQRLDLPTHLTQYSPRREQTG